MSRKSLILCLSALAVMVLGIGIAVAVLYSGTGSSGKAARVKAADSECGLLLAAVPSDAVLVASYSDCDLLPDMDKAVMSLHYYSGKLCRLYVMDEPEKPEQTELVLSSASGKGFHIAQEGGLVLMSDSETLLKSSQRHISKGISVLDASGFREAAGAVKGNDVLYISNSYMDRLLPVLMPRPYSGYSGFMERLADWSVFEIENSQKCTSLTGSLLHDSGPSEFAAVLESMKPAVSRMSEILPSYTLFAASLPMKDINAYVNAYKSYLDSRQKLQVYLSEQSKVGTSGSPVDMLLKWEVTEVGVVSFKSGSGVETVNLMRVDAPDAGTLFAGTDVSSLKGYVPAVHQWAWPSLLSSVFGDFFARKDETCFTFVDGWVVTGSQAAVEEYSSGRALEYRLEQYMKDAGESDLLAGHPSSFVAYFSFTEDRSELQSIFRKTLLKDLQDMCADAEYCPFVLSVVPGKNGASVNLDMHRLTLKKTKAPVFERDTVVLVPKGPFEVRNSGTGKMNRFYQNSHNSLCLSQEGKDLWGVPFDKPICGRAGTVDFFANGKLQILFCAGDKLYLIDRLGRYVKGFPLTLDKEVLLGPDIYDFNGTRKYNVMVLHKDNTVQMYNLKGQKPASWKGITASETIKNLPERLVVGGSTFWVVRTSIQTLIYPFYGGEPLTTFTGDQMIRPDSQVKAVDGTTVEFTCYDGKVRTAALK